MCLAIPGQIIEFTDTDLLTRRGIVDFEGIRKEVSLAFVPEAEAGDYVLVHVGFGISRVDQEEAERVFEFPREMGELDELETEPS